MPTYTLNHAYEAYRDGTRFGPWQAGDVVNLDLADAEWVERDSAGALSVVAYQGPTGPASPVAAAGARPRVGGDPELAEAAAAAQERVHAEAVARKGPPPDAPAEDVEEAPPAEGDDDPADDGPAEDEQQEDGKRQQKPARNRQHRGGANRSA